MILESLNFVSLAYQNKKINFSGFGIINVFIHAPRGEYIYIYIKMLLGDAMDKSLSRDKSHNNIVLI